MCSVGYSILTLPGTTAERDGERGAEEAAVSRSRNSELEALWEALRGELEASKRNRDAIRELRDECAVITQRLEGLAAELQPGSLPTLRSVG